MNSPQFQDKLSGVVSQFWEDALQKMDALAIPIVFERIEYWACSQLDLTSILCDYVLLYGSQITASNAKAAVDTIVQQEITDDWENSEAAPHLLRVQQTLLSYDRKDSLLISYIRVLQRGQVPADNSSEQFVLMRSGLLEIERGTLKVASPLYAKVFDSTWVERQLPGITKPVAIVAPRQASDGPSSRSKLFSKLAIAACGLAVLGAAISSYIKESGGEAIAIDTANDLPLNEPTLVQPETATITEPITKPIEPITRLSQPENSSVSPVTELTPSAPAVVPTDKFLFDNGEEHAKNSRWVLMMREFCQLSPDSAYFAPAESNLNQWAKLYPNDILIAQNIVVQEQGSCAIAEAATGSAAAQSSATQSSDAR